MKLPMQSKEATKFIKEANNGDLKPKSKVSSILFSEKQNQFVSDLLAQSGITTYRSLFRIAIQFFKLSTPDFLEYTRFLPFLLEEYKSASNFKKITFDGEDISPFLKEWIELYSEHLKLKMKNILLLVLIHYAKHNTKFDVDSIL